MRYYFITFRSVTYAQRGEQILSRAGIRCALMRTPKWMEAQGCGYSLRIRTDDVGSAVAVLRENKALMRKVYVQREDGALEEMAV